MEAFLMDFISIFSALSEWAIFALLIGSAGFTVIISGYLFYRKKLHGKHRVSKRQFIVLFLLLGWFLVVLGLSTLSRGANYADAFNFNMFSGYVNAWSKWSMTELQMILFNMLMFLPLGVLLPLLSGKTERFSVLLTVSFAVTVGIEILQLITSTGIFELDDLFHNMLGSIMGYALITAILHCLREKKLVRDQIAKALAIPLCICLVLTAVFAVYQIKELGNMPILPAAKQDMKEVTVKSSIKLPDKAETVSLYRNGYVNDLAHGKKVAKIVSEKYDLTISGPIRTNGVNRAFTLKDRSGNSYYLDYNMKDGTWNIYTENPANGSPAAVANSQKTDLEAWMQENDLLQSQAKFQLQNGNILRWDLKQPADILSRSKSFYDGIVMITPSDGNVPSEFMDTVVEKEFIRKVSIISPKKAFEKVLLGDFEMYTPFKAGDQLFVTGYEISYTYDTKGYYQPIYYFEGYINGTDYPWRCAIPAMSKAR
jgi:glycopeptide antibiotics resistance protein